MVGRLFFDILQSKHPPPSAPTKEALINISVFPEFEEVELTYSMYCVLLIRYKELLVQVDVIKGVARFIKVRGLKNSELRYVQFL